MKELNQHIKSGNFATCYLFHGTEAFLMRHWQKRLVEALAPDANSFNMEVLDGKTPAKDIIASAETLPFMAEHRLIILKNTGLFETGRKDDAEALAKYIPDIPETTVILFAEEKVDKRGKLYKRVKESGLVMEAATPSEADLADWAMKMCASRGKKLGRAAAAHMMRSTTLDMQLLHNELEKLIAHAGDGEEITVADIDAVCTKSLDVKIFAMMDAVGAGNARASTKMYRDMMTLGESPFYILSMIARQYRFYIQCSHMAGKGSRAPEIAKTLGQHPFAVENFIKGSRGKFMPALLNALNQCLETDYAIKSGQMNDATAVETLIIKLCT
ncbi:MAG: DNA polymerase III subunit delta [Defluviitaleaceae bacterium]|nr:DNA polymerase III subunit delta [Defluviitaleaceae bacterium]